MLGGIVFDDIIADVTSNRKLHPVVTKLFIRGCKLNIFFGVHYTVILPCTKKSYTSLYHEDSKEVRGSANCY